MFGSTSSNHSGSADLPKSTSSEEEERTKGEKSGTQQESDAGAETADELLANNKVSENKPLAAVGGRN